MTELQKEFEATGYASWINSDAYPDGKIYTDEYVKWLEKQVVVLRNSQPNPLGWIVVSKDYSITAEYRVDVLRRNLEYRLNCQ